MKDWRKEDRQTDRQTETQMQREKKTNSQMFTRALAYISKLSNQESTTLYTPKPKQIAPTVIAIFFECPSILGEGLL